MPGPLMSTRRAIAVLAATGMALTGAGCTSAKHNASAVGHSPKVPAGYVAYDSPLFRFAYPAGWTIATSKGPQGDDNVDFKGPMLADGTRSCFATVTTRANFDGDVVASTRGLLALQQDANQVVTENKEFTAPGVKHGVVLDRSYDSYQRGTGKKYRLRLLERHLVTTDRTAIAFLVTARADNPAACPIDAIFETFSVKPPAK